MHEKQIQLNIEDLDEAVKKITEFLELAEQANQTIDKIHFITATELAAMTGWSLKTTRELFNKIDFPSCDYGKEKIAEIDAVKKYFSVSRKKHQTYR